MDIDIIEQRPVTLAEVSDSLEIIKTKINELNFRAEKVRNYVNETKEVEKKNADELLNKIKELNISRLRDKHLVKIVDLMPEDVESLKSLFAGEATSLKQEELNKILEVIKQNV